MKTWRERTPSNCRSRGEEVVLCSYRRRIKDKFVKRMGTIAHLVAATPAGLWGRLADSFCWSNVSSCALPNRPEKGGWLFM